MMAKLFLLKLIDFSSFYYLYFVLQSMGFCLATPSSCIKFVFIAGFQQPVYVHGTPTHTCCKVNN